MFRPDYEYSCLLGIYDPLRKSFHPDYMINNRFERQPDTPSDTQGCRGSTDIFSFEGLQSPRAILVSRPFRANSYAWVEHYYNGAYVVDSYSLYSDTEETPRLIWLPYGIRRIVFNIRVEDMGYEPSWYAQDAPITEPCDKDFINGIGLYFMYDASPHYSKLELSRSKDSQATTGRFLRDKITTDLTFVGRDFDRLTEEYDYQTDRGVSEYATCAVVFYERFEEKPYQDYMAACCYFNRADAEVSFSECYVKPNLKTLDSYSWMLDRYSTERNITRIQASVEKVRITIPPVLQFYVIGSDSVTNVCNDSCWEQPVSDPDISANDLFKAGFAYVSADLVPSTIATNRAMNIVLHHYRALGTDYRIVYALNAATGEYAYENTINYDVEPTDEWPYDKLVFRYRGGNIECVNSETGVILRSLEYHSDQDPSDVWPPYPDINFTGHNNDFINGGGSAVWWSCYSANIDATPGILARILMHSDVSNDRRAIGDFASLSKWYNKLAYPENASGNHYISWNSYLMFKETNQLTKIPTEYGLHSPDNYYTNDGLSRDSYLWGIKPMPVLKSWWGDYSYWLDIIGSDAESWLDGMTSTVYVNDCYTLDSVIRRLLNSYGLSFNFENTVLSSQLIYGNPDYMQTNNHFLKCRKVYLIPSTNITRGEYTQAAQNGTISLKELLDDICMSANAGWHVDRDGLHIEGSEWYDHGRSYSNLDYNPDFDFEYVVDEFNDTNVLYGQIAYSPDTNGLWHTLSLGNDSNTTKHFLPTKMAAKSLFCQGDTSISPKLTYDLLGAIAVKDSIGEDSILCIGSDYAEDSVECSVVDKTLLYDVKVESVSSGIAARIMNKAFSWPYLKGRYVHGLPADKSLIEYGWLTQTMYASIPYMAYTRPHRTISIRMPIVSSLYIRGWMLVKTTLGYGVVSQVNIDLISRVANITVDILEYNI